MKDPKSKIVRVLLIEDNPGDARLMQEMLAEARGGFLPAGRQAFDYMATHDVLTGLPNRLGFFTLAEQQLKMANRTKRGTMLFFADLDGLKQINDTFSHREGDRALIGTTDVLAKTFRESDIVARIGGDEFVVLAMEINEVNSELLTTRLRENLEAHNAKAGRRYKLSLSVGAAYYDPGQPCSLDELLTRADRLMYEQKQSKRRFRKISQDFGKSFSSAQDRLSWAV